MLQIKSETNGTTRLFQDGKEITGIKSISFTHDAMTDNPELKVVFARDDVEIDALCAPSLPEFYRPFYAEREPGPPRD